METLIICSNQQKNRILESLNDKPLTNISFMTKKEFIHQYYFDYNTKTIYYLMNKYHYKYDIALEYLNNLYYIESKDYKSSKLKHLKELKEYLDNNNLLVYNSLFKQYLRSKKIIFIGYLSKYDLRLIDELKKNYTVEIQKKEVNNYNPKVYSFKMIDEEVEYVAYQICKLIDNGILPSKIKLANINEDYNCCIKRIFKLYNLKVQEQKQLFGMNIIKDFLNFYQSDITITIDKLKGKYDNQLINKLINIVNKYNFIDDYMKVKDIIVEEIKRTTIKTNYHNQIDIIDYHDTYDDEYIFLMNFNEESIPKKYQDIDYINDDIKPEYLDNTIDKNKLEKKITTNFIKSTKNLIITYKEKTPFSSFYPSSLINDLNLIVEEGILDKTISYSYSSGLIKTCKMYDEYYKYGILNEDIALYSYNYPINYNSYSNKFNGDFKYNDEFILSYTSMDTYYKCRFKYYLDRILKININDNNLSQYIGSIFHYVLEKCLYSDLNYQDIIKEYILKNNLQLSIKEKHFLNKLTNELPQIITILKKQEQYIKLKNYLTEEKVIVDFENCKFMGVIDKVLYDNDIYAIIDYKTGNTDIKLNNIQFGLGMQLPVYLYLAHKKFGGHLAGFYLNKIIQGNIKYDLKKDYEEIYQDNLKLFGYSNKKYIKDFDLSYKNSQIIQSLKVKDDGDFYYYSKVLTDTEMDELSEIVEDKIIECIDSIRQTKFDINPKNIKGKNISCEYCKYSDICFKKNEDIVYLKEDKDESC